MTDAPPKPIRFADLGRRLGSGLALSAIVLIDIWLGGPWVTALFALAVVLMLWEYHRLVTDGVRLTAPSLLVLAGFGAAGVVATAGFGLPVGLALLCFGGAALYVLARAAVSWLAAGLFYIGFAMCYLIVIRNSEPDGVLIILWLLLVVIATDVGAYFVGRSLGGARLWPAVSPGKTWAGAVGGLGFAAGTGVIFAVLNGAQVLTAGALSIGVAIAAQLGDLLESALKRRFGAKDTSRLIPGHGGMLDRLDGVLGAVWFFAACDVAGFGPLG